jgi:hypothetical protein
MTTNLNQQKVLKAGLAEEILAAHLKGHVLKDISFQKIAI